MTRQDEIHIEQVKFRIDELGDIVEVLTDMSNNMDLHESSKVTHVIDKLNSAVELLRDLEDTIRNKKTSTV